MAHSASNARADDPKSVIDQLRHEILELEDDDELMSAADTDDERWGETNLAGSPLHYSAVATAASDILIARRDLSADARASAVTGVRQALAERRRMAGPLPIVLRAVREQANVTLDDLASRSGIPKNELRDLERGETPTNRNLKASTVASWIHSLPVKRSTASAALRQSLSAAAADQPLLAAGLGEPPAADDDYVARVESLLDQADQEASQ